MQSRTWLGASRRSLCWRRPTPSSVPSRLGVGRSDLGGAVIELAVVTPLLLGMCLGVGDFGRVFYWTITLSNAARAGAAYGAQSNAFAGDSTGIRLAAEGEAQDIAPISVASQQVCECLNGTAIACTTANCTGYGTPRSFVVVTATKTFGPLVPWPGLPGTIPLSRIAKVRVR